MKTATTNDVGGCVGAAAADEEDDDDDFRFLCAVLF